MPPRALTRILVPGLTALAAGNPRALDAVLRNARRVLDLLCLSNSLCEPHPATLPHALPPFRLRLLHILEV